MRLKTAFISLVLLICPCALCYGQLSFSGVNGERGYAAMRGMFKLDLDNGFVFTPQYGYYRMSDKEIDEAGSTSRYGLEGAYELNDDWTVFAEGFWQPQAVGYQAVGYGAGLRWKPFYRWGMLKNPLLTVKAEQTRYRTYVDKMGNDLTGGSFGQIETGASAQVSADAGAWNLKAAWHKVIKYSSRVPQDVTFSWADIPFMTAVVQGFVKEAAAVRVSYRTDFITPYASLARYRYAELSDTAAAVSAGLHVRLWEMTLSGGVEVFEPRRESNRRTYFSMSAEVEF